MRHLAHKSFAFGGAAAIGAGNRGFQIGTTCQDETYIAAPSFSAKARSRVAIASGETAALSDLNAGASHGDAGD